MTVVIGVFRIQRATSFVQALNRARSAAYIIWKIIDEPSKINNHSEIGLKKADLIGNIDFSNVFFSYPSRPDIPILNGISFNVKHAQTIALVGSSGSGKSTCIQLLQRFYDPYSGSIIIDGNQINQYNLNWLRQQIGVVSQEPVLFHTTIRQNILFGHDSATDEELHQAAKIANAHNFIMTLPDKYETQIGERGATLSGGQKQRIAIARALIRNPKILLLDEATSALDNESEKIVQEALDRAAQNRTTFVIAHRLSTIRYADKIIVMEKGKIVEEGDHETLMKIKGVYCELVEQQRLRQAEEDEDEEEEFEQKDRATSMSFCDRVRSNSLDVLSKRASTIISSYLFACSGEILTKRLRSKAFRAILRQEPAYFDQENHSTGALCTRLAIEASAVQGASGVHFGIIFQSLISMISGIILGFVFSWQLTLLIMGFLPVLLFGSISRIRLTARFESKDNKILENAGKVAVETIQNIRTVMQLTKEDHFYNEYCQLINIIYRSSLKRAHLSSIIFALSNSITFFTTAAFIALGAFLVDQNTITFQDMYMVFNSVAMLAQYASRSGGGKSTIIQLMERFYDPSFGSLLIDSKDLRSLNLQWYRSQIGIVSQESILFDMSIRENIAYGDNSRTDIPLDEIIQAAKNANIHHFIQSLPHGYETNCGTKGTQLSGGQKQRIAIARALIRNPKILLLDEATSALDSQSEKMVQEALDYAQQNRTSITIAHRLSTIQNADMICVIHNGSIVESGNHEQLLARNGRYFRLIQKIFK
ncbi:unnamed protein product [Rotaria sordida]|uniref:Uncharacterized protein n=1 Tax=Rotaria sordida TaxID=392033 RepID=A0A815HSW3_9BILA|nr:unnamed protein product [Rotaria sordida]CAF1402307.1 unnamed protein product [Rotaria sordida]CAF1416261.1 unnamed protein product [Rotaria sordida]